MNDKMAAIACVLLAVLSTGCGPASLVGSAGISIYDLGTNAPWFHPLAEVVAQSDGTTTAVHIQLDPEPSVVLFRTSFADGRSHPETCLQLDSVVYRDAEVWVPPATDRSDWGPYCVTCRQRAAVGHGYGLFSFPNDGSPLPAGGALQLRPVLRDCATNLPLDPRFGDKVPAPIRVEVARYRGLAAGASGRLRLSLLFAPGGQLSAATSATDPIFLEALAMVRAELAPALIEVEVVSTADLPGSANPAPSFSAADHSQLEELAAAAHRVSPASVAELGAAVTVVFPRCIVQLDTLGGATTYPNGFATHIPGALASAVFIRGGACDPNHSAAYWPGGRLLGKVMAHEIGHHLGLYHTVEPDGRTDNLPDTSDANLMDWSVLGESSEGLTPGQREVIRLHPSLAVPL